MDFNRRRAIALLRERIRRRHVRGGVLPRAYRFEFDDERFVFQQISGITIEPADAEQIVAQWQAQRAVINAWMITLAAPHGGFKLRGALRNLRGITAVVSDTGATLLFPEGFMRRAIAILSDPLVDGLGNRLHLYYAAYVYTLTDYPDEPTVPPS